MARFVVGLTGGIGSGKTTVSNMFADRGIIVADADVVARQIVEPGEEAFDAIVEHFGSSILAESGELNRGKLREIVFSDATERTWLERQTQGRIMAKLAHIIEAARSPFSMLVLSAGRGKNPLMSRMLVVDVPPEMQVARVTERDNNSAEQVEAIMATQPSREDRISWADDVIVNNGDLDTLSNQVAELYETYLQQANNS